MTRSTLRRSSRAPDAWDRWAWAWDLGFYALLALATGATLLDGVGPSEAAAGRATATGLALLLAGWYWLLIVRVARHRDEVRPVALYLAPAYATWLALVWLHPAYWMVLSALFWQTYGFLPIRWSIPFALALTGLIVWRSLAVAPSAAWPTVIAIGVISTAIGSCFALWIDAIIEQSRGRQALIEELEATRRDLAVAERRAGVLAERQRLAHEIHDTLAQGFTSIVLHLEAADAALPPGGAPARRHVEQARRMARESLTEARRLVWALRPAPLDGASLAEALRRVARRWSEETGAGADVAVTGAARALPPEYEITLLRAVQEALANCRKHARARRVTITLSYLDDRVLLDVQDDGAGFDPAPVLLDGRGDPEGGFGLCAMRARAEQLGGRLLVESAPGDGATLVVELPLGVGARVAVV